MGRLPAVCLASAAVAAAVATTTASCSGAAGTCAEDSVLLQSSLLQRRTSAGIVRSASALSLEARRRSERTDRLPLIPYPASLELPRQVERPFVLTSDTVLVLPPDVPQDSPVARALRNLLAEAGGASAAAAPIARLHLHLDGACAGGNTEGYELSINAGNMSLRAPTLAGLFYGAQTMRQLAKRLPGGGEGYVLPGGLRVSDAPLLAWRGLHLDVSRHFFDAEDVKKLLDTMSLFKLNRFHWHLTDDQGWRLPIVGYPSLTRLGAESVDGQRRAYTSREIRDVIEYARERYIEVLPEIDVPGHVAAAIAAYPALGNADIPGWRPPVAPAKEWGAQDFTLGPSNETMYFLRSVFQQVSELFPSAFAHVGGDEASQRQWSASEQALAAARSEGLSQVQAYFNKHVSQLLLENNRTVVAWDEAQHVGGLPDDAVIMAWRSPDELRTALLAGRRVVNADMNALYFDHYQGSEVSEPKAICCHLSLEEVYAYDPMPAWVAEDKEKRRLFLGVQAQLWSEYFPNWAHVEYMAFPRALALAERSWTPGERLQGFEDFRARLKARMGDLASRGVNSRRLD